MAKQRQVSDRFWCDPYIAEELTEPDEKLLFLYLLTNQYVSITGIYEISIRTITFDTGITPERIKEIIQKLTDAGKVYYDKGYIILANYYKHVTYNNPNVRAHVTEQLNAIPNAIKELHTATVTRILDIVNSRQTQGEPFGMVNKPKGNPRQTVPNEIETVHQPFETPRARPIPIPIPIPIPNTIPIPTSIPPTPQGVSDVSTPQVNPQGWTGGRKEIESSQGMGGTGRKGQKLEKLADGIYMTAIEQQAFRDDYGDDLFIDIPDKVSEWAEANNIKVKDGYKMCCQFADREVKRGKVV